MRKLAGILRGKKIYDDDPNLTRLQCETEYIAVWGNGTTWRGELRCAYCGRTGKEGNECKACGAPL